MAASINDKFTEATNGSRPVPTTLTAILASGASPGTATCGALTGWATATAVHFIIYTVDVNGRKVSGSQTDWKGVVSGSTITGLVLKAGTNNGYAIGAIVEAAPTAAWADDVTEGIMVEHKQTGAHATVTADSVASAGAVSGTTISGTAINSSGDMQLRSTSLEAVHGEWLRDYVASGGVWSGDSYGSTRAASMTAAVVYIAGRRVSVTAVTARTFTASKDTYMDVDNTGTITYTEVANNAASPALSAGNLRLGVIITAAGSIANVGSVNQGQEDKLLPIASSTPYQVTDSLGNMICNRDPFSKIVGYRQITTSPTAAALAAVTGLSMPVIVPANRKIKFRIVPGVFVGVDTASVQGCVSIWDGTVGSGTQLAEGRMSTAAINQSSGVVCETIRTLSTGSHTINGGLRTIGGGTTTLTSGATTTPTYIIAELI